MEFQSSNQDKNPLARRKIGPNFIKSKALLLKESPIAGGYFTTQATTIFSATQALNRFKAARGKTMCADDFYEG